MRRPGRDLPKVKPGGKAAHGPRQGLRRLRSISLGPRITTTTKAIQSSAPMTMINASSIADYFNSPSSICSPFLRVYCVNKPP